jgi:2-polyprenyl-6-hydroxyphenyl methylase/3-demethylubiquinone-9 3-methyltransferase
VLWNGGEGKVSSGWSTTQFSTTEELGKYAWAQGFFHASHHDWDGKTWVRNFHELRTRDLALFALGTDVKSRRVLEVGCGSGEYLVTLAKMGATVAGQDISSEAVARAEGFLKEEGFQGELRVGDAVELRFPDNDFDLVMSADFFEHISLDQKRRVISEIYRVLKPGGSVVIKTPNLTYLKLVINAKRILNLLRWKSPFIFIPHTHENPDNEHHGLTTFSELERLLEGNFFHSPRVTYVPLVRNGLPRFASKWMYGKKMFTEHIILTSRKSLFCGFYG